MCKLVHLLKLYLLIAISNSSRILVFNPFPAYSHQVVFHGLVKTLVERGHEIVFITTHPMNDKSLNNVREIDVSFSQQMWIHAVNTAKPDIFNKVLFLYEIIASIIEVQLKHPEVQALIKNKTEHFDLVLLSYTSPAIFAFKIRFQCPFIAVLTLEIPNKDHIAIGNGINSASHPDALLYKPVSNLLIRRVYNFCMNTILQLHKMYVIDPIATKVIKNNFGQDYPDSGSLTRDVDLLFVSSNLALHEPRPVSACTIFIGGGIHIKEPKELPQDLKTFLDNSTKGVIYMSFGSSLQTASLSDKVKQVFFKTFADLPYDILWKCENETSKAIPKNVFMLKWMPQQDILRHKNIKLFITHGGQQSTEEAVLNHIPMLAIPFFSDQMYNSHKIHTKKMGTMIDDLDSLTSNQLKYLVLELIQNPTYKNNIKEISAKLVDAPMTPQEKVVWWTEYVIRHKGAKHLRGPDLPTYQLYLLDVFGMLLLVMLILLFVIYTILKYALKLCSFLTKRSDKLKVQ